MTPRRSTPITDLRLNRRSLMAVTAGGVAVATLGRGATVHAQDKPEVIVGSKDFTEQIIISEMTALMLEEAGYGVERQLNLGGSGIVHEALVSGEIDVYTEYTGTALLVTLGLELPAADAESTPMASPTADASPVAGGGLADTVYQIVATEYASQFNLVWLDPLGFNNTYTLAVRADTASELGLTKISDLVGKEGDLTFGATTEFVTRPDGLPGVSAAYGLSFGDEVGMDSGLVYGALDSEDVDVISAFATDGRIPQLGLVLLEDDLGFFPPYFAAPVVKQELLDEDPAVRDVLNQLAGKIDNATMAGLNAQVDVDKIEAIDVARTYLQGQGLVS